MKLENKNKNTDPLCWLHRGQEKLGVQLRFEVEADDQDVGLVHDGGDVAVAIFIAEIIEADILLDTVDNIRGVDRQDKIAGVLDQLIQPINCELKSFPVQVGACFVDEISNAVPHLAFSLIHGRVFAGDSQRVIRIAVNFCLPTYGSGEFDNFSFFRFQHNNSPSCVREEHMSLKRNGVYAGFAGIHFVYACKGFQHFIK